MAEDVITNFIKNGMAVRVSRNDNLCRATTGLIIDNAGKYLSYPLMKMRH
jgi:hypothetical protein